MPDIINLNRYRKRRRREEAEQIAAARRLEFGRSKPQRELQASSERLLEKSLDGHRRIREDDT
ncbi:DUF4169 family protein [Starkeya koreensis]|uniref:DUF4169 family protein n=1 Tax=Ancylobacter koreensis TaxID=266121 RepID=A0ABT0DLB8_9HYPH|nr:DUF4169 family protein [Ancylobacter koreensis]MCK0208072.1 DUF4169 family protein [Ancylobacter koreensis]